MPSLEEQILQSLQATMDNGDEGEFIVTVEMNRQAAYAAVFLSIRGLPVTFITK
jgi:hypothetical protein